MNNSSKVSPELEIMRHSLAHILAMALLRIYPGAKLGIGPALDHGFYYEVDTATRISFKDLPKIEAEMRKIISEELPFKQFMTPKEQAFDTLLQAGQIYKSELLQQIPDEQVSFYRTGEFFDLCRGPHVADTSKVGAFKLNRISSSYWLGQKNRPKLTKIEGVAFRTQAEVDAYIEKQRELAQRDYRKIGRNMQLLAFDEELGNEFVTWLPKGNLIKDTLTEYIFKLLTAHGFARLQTPAISKFSAYRDYFEDENLKKEYLPILKVDDNQYLLRKNAFYQHTSVYKATKRSYRSMPVRFFEQLDSYFVKKDTLNHSQAIQCHSFTTKEQVSDEIETMIKLLDATYSMIGIAGVQIHAKIPDAESKNPALEMAQEAVGYMQKALASLKRVAKIMSEEHCQEGGTLSFVTKDIHGHYIELASIKIDMISGLKEKLQYYKTDNTTTHPVIIEMNVLSSFDILFKLLLEQNLGAFPIWLAPTQVVIIAISEKFNHNAQEVYDLLLKENIRVDMNTKDEPMQSKIRAAEQDSIPYMVIVGEKEIRTSSVSVRQRNGQELGLIRIEEFVDRLRSELFPKIV